MAEISILEAIRRAAVASKEYTDEHGGGGTWGNITGTLSNQTDLNAALNAKADKAPAVYAYDGADLSTVFSSAAALHTAIAAGDFSKIHIGDYWPIRLEGSYKDWATFTIPSGTTYYSDAELTTVAGTTSAVTEGEYHSASAIKFKVSTTTFYVAIEDCTVGFEKTIGYTAKMEVAAINPCIGFGNPMFTTPHVFLCCRDCIPGAVKYRRANDLWYDTTQVNPWLGSALYATLNDPNTGIVKLVEASTIGDIIYKGPNGKGIRAFALPKMLPGASATTGRDFMDRGILFLPTEREVCGANIYSINNGDSAGSIYNQWPIFTGSSRHISKGTGETSSRNTWWLQDATSSTTFAQIMSYGWPKSEFAGGVASVAFCFVIT